VTPNGVLRIQYEGDGYEGAAVIERPVDKLRDGWANSLEHAIKGVGN
jgi:hypothetical protein